MKINSQHIDQFDFSDYTNLKNLIDDWKSASNYIVANSSGSTGVPKTLEISKRDIERSAKLTADYFGVKSNSTVLLALPLSFIAGKMMVLRSIINEWNLVITDHSTNPIIPEIELDFAAFTPLQAENLLENQFERFNSISTVILGGGAISNSLLMKLKKCTNRIFATYGMTETVTHVAASELKTQGDVQVFEALPGVRFSLDSRDCLCIQATHLEAKNFVTNDIVELLDSTHFSFLGRIDGIINSAGLKVIPEKLELEIDSFIDANFYVTSIKDTQLGEKVVLMIEGLESNFHVQIEKLKNHFENRVDRPREFFFREKFNYTHTGKIIKKYF